MFFSHSFLPSYNIDQGPTEIPLAIMTSDDTHSRTIKVLETNNYFGMKPSQVKLLKQVTF